ncbi:ABC transporter substrate-binding protein [Bifidobacterium felsineum]|uniref:ABC transporter substrate-binding protein n=1 Tax=Bifidobacterium felsineum TaxID=2045440 RepID=A0A2M9HMW2_9BIFI|nr:ABC transporter substrate-binding protein [Bifidobacterium felsineum]PJM78164.1 ABC transporter substrate-binding protein [Bifidobacterium felsineum]
MRSEQHRKQYNGLVSWGVFLGVALALGALVWAGWSVLIQHRSISLSALMHGTPQSSVTIGIDDMPQSLDIRSAGSSSAERLLIDNVYETLITVDQQNQLKPGLATVWKVSDNALKYTFTIAPSVTFSNGHTLDSSDVVWSLQQAITQKYAGVDALGDTQSITNPDSTTVVITLAKPNPTLLRALSGRLGIVYDSEAGNADYANSAVGSGPFTVSAFKAAQSLTLQYNGSYHGAKAKVGSITFNQYSDENTLAKALADGTVDLAMPTTATVASAAKEKQNLKVSEGATTDKVLLAFNNSTDSLMSDEQIRKAMRHLVDASSIASSQPDSAGALGGPISPLEPGYEDLTGLFPYDLNQARTMLGYFAPQFIPSVDIVVTEQYRSIAETIAQQISQVSLPKVNLEVVSDEDYAKRIQDGSWELTIMSMNGTDDAGTFADPSSLFHYDHSEAEQAYASAREATNDQDYAERMKAYAKVVSEDAASDWLYTRKCFTVASTKVSGYPTSLIDTRMPLGALDKQ